MEVTEGTPQDEQDPEGKQAPEEELATALGRLPYKRSSLLRENNKNTEIIIDLKAITVNN